MIYLLIWWCFGIASAVVASNRGSNGFVWFILGFFLGPFALLAAFTEGVRCPYCQSKISKKALVCPNCQKEQPTKPQPVIPTPEEQQRMAEESRESFKKLMKNIAIGTPIVILVVLLLTVFVFFFSPQQMQDKIKFEIKTAIFGDPDAEFEGKTAVVIQDINALEYGSSTVVFTLKKDQAVIIERKLHDKCQLKKDNKYAWVDCNKLK